MSKAIVVQGDREQLPELYLKETDLVKPLTEDLIEGIAEGVRSGLSPERACAILKIGASQFREWYEAGKALYGQQSHASIPNLIPLQAGEDKEEYEERYREWLEQCDLRVKLYLECNAKLSELSKDMLVVWKEHAMAGAYDSWKAAKAMEERITGTQKNVVEHVHSGEVHTRHAQQVNMILGNFISAASKRKEELEEFDIIEGEVIDE